MAARTLGRSDHLVQQFFPAGDCCFRACGRTIEHGKVSHYTGTIRARARVLASIRLTQGAGENLVDDGFARSAR
jgi:hypothetical protein